MSSTTYKRLASDFRVLRQLLLHRRQGVSQQEILEDFYSHQAQDYDSFRQRLLPGRTQLIQSLPFPEGGVWADFGAGTGANLEYVRDQVPMLREIYLLDLSNSLLRIAEQRIAAHGWAHVRPQHADVTQPVLAKESCDVITFSYSLTMIPDWFAALNQAWDALKPGGIIGVVDFFISRPLSEPGAATHSWWTRTFWPTWFAFDHVFLSRDHLPYLKAKWQLAELNTGFHRLPWFPGSRAPYYTFIGRKPR